MANIFYKPNDRQPEFVGIDAQVLRDIADANDLMTRANAAAKEAHELGKQADEARKVARELGEQAQEIRGRANRTVFVAPSDLFLRNW